MPDLLTGSASSGVPGLGEATERSGLRWLGKPARVVLEVLPVWLVGLLLGQWSGPFGTRILRVNWWAATDLISRISPYRAWLPDGATFGMPPAAGLLLSPLAIGGYFAWQCLWPLAQALATRSVLRCLGIGAGWPRLTAGLLVCLLIAPGRDDIRLGGVGLILLALALTGLVRPGRSRTGHRRGPGSGVGLGLAVAIAWPLLGVVVLVLLTDRRRTAWTALATAALATWMAWALVPGAAAWYGRLPWPGNWMLLCGGGHSLVGVLNRLFGLSDLGAWLMFLVGLLLLGLALVPARRWWLAGNRPLAVGVVGLAGSLLLPMPGAAGVIWVVPAIVGAWRATGLGPVGRILLWSWFGWLAVTPGVGWPIDVAAGLGVVAILGLAIECARDRWSPPARWAGRPELRDDPRAPGGDMP